MRITETKRTVVDRIALADAAFFARLLSSPGWRRFISDRGTVDRSAAEAYLRDKLLPVYEQHGFGYYVIRLCGDEPIGVCGFLKKPHLENPDFGFALLPEYEGQGLASEAAAAVLEFGQKEFDFKVLDAETQEENHASIRLLKKLGFEEVGSLSNPDVENKSLIFRWWSDSPRGLE